MIIVSQNKLGQYKTEERAKEVLQEIINMYTGSINIEYRGQCNYNPINAIRLHKYEMPED